MRNDSFEVVFILDRSGSMNGLEKDTIGGYNKLLEEQKLLPGDVTVSTVLFNDAIEVIHDRVSIKEVNAITENEYYVGGFTALYDAVGQSINHIGKQLFETDENSRPSKVMIVIVTDGMENASREYSHTMIKKMIDHQKTKYSWDFIFLGANFDAEAFSESISIDKDRAVQYENDKEGIESIYVNLSEELTTRRFPLENKKSDTWKKGIKKGKWCRWFRD